MPASVQDLSGAMTARHRHIRRHRSCTEMADQRRWFCRFVAGGRALLRCCLLLPPNRRPNPGPSRPGEQQSLAAPHLTAEHSCQASHPGDPLRAKKTKQITPCGVPRCKPEATLILETRWPLRSIYTFSKQSLYLLTPLSACTPSPKSRIEPPTNWARCE